MWKTITHDRYILNAVKGYSLEFTSVPVQYSVRETKLNSAEAVALDRELLKLMAKGVVEKASHSDDEYISSVFLRPKKDGSYRVILNLKQLNENIEYAHFKMETLCTALRLIQPGCYMGSVDLSDAYYTVNVAYPDRKYLRFIWKGTLYQYTCLPNGLSSAPRLFTKLLKPVYASLRSKGHVSVAYIDDSYLQGETYEQCLKNIQDTIDLFEQLGFKINKEKSVVVPTHEIVFLGFVLNSKSMTISLTPEKIKKFKNLYHNFCSNKSHSIRQVAELVGVLISSSVAIPLGLLHTKLLEKEKAIALKCNKGNFDSKMTLSAEALQDLKWWSIQINSGIKAPIRQKSIQATLTTDASGIGWGAEYNGVSTGGHWSIEEKQYLPNINYLELHAVFLGLQSFHAELCNKHVKIYCDNSTTVAYINNMGGTKSTACNYKAREIWTFVQRNNMWLTAVHLPGVDNVVADRESRMIRDETEWMLNEKLFKTITSVYFKPHIDLFASRLNKQLECFVSWKNEPGASFVDAFTISWINLSFYAFPPFSIIDRVCQKILMDKAEGLLVTPLWDTQNWYPIILRMCVKPPLALKPSKTMLQLKNSPTQVHPLARKLHLMVCHVSGKISRNLIYRKDQFQFL